MKNKKTNSVDQFTRIKNPEIWTRVNGYKGQSEGKSKVGYEDSYRVESDRAQKRLSRRNPDNAYTIEHQHELTSPKTQTTTEEFPRRREKKNQEKEKRKRRLDDGLGERY